MPVARSLRHVRRFVFAAILAGSVGDVACGQGVTLGLPVAVSPVETSPAIATPTDKMPAPRPAGYGEAAAPNSRVQPAALPIDLPTVLRLVDNNNPSIGLARARVEEAYQRWEQAKVLWLPTLSAGGTYLRHDGQIQRAPGEVITTSRSSIFSGGIAAARFDTSLALFAPLVARQLTDAEAARTQAVTQNRQLDAALAYFDLLQLHGQIAINADTLARAEQMLNRAIAADKTGLSKNKSDVNRAETEVNIRKQEAIVLRGRTAAASARLVRLLLLDPTVELVPADLTVLPITLLPPSATIEGLIQLGYSQRPEVAAARSLIGASEARLSQAKFGPLLPKVQLEYGGGLFGGGINSSITNTAGRGDGTAAVYWELRNLGLGNLGEIRERRAGVDQQRFFQLEVEAQVAAEVAEAAKLAGARFQSLDNAEKAVINALEMYRKLLETSFGMIGPRAQYDALEPLLAIQALNQARILYLNEVAEFNRLQFRLYTAIGQPPLQALSSMTVTPLPTTTTPTPPKGP